MALPHSRNETFVADDIVGGSILMAVQFWLAAFFRKGRRKSKSLIVSPFGARGTWPSWSSGAATMYVLSSAGAQTHRIPLLLRHGDFLTNITPRYWRNGVTNLSFALKRYSLTAAGVSTVASGTLSAASGAWGSTTIALTHTVDQAYVYFLEVTSGQASDRLSQIEISFSHP